MNKGIIELLEDAARLADQAELAVKTGEFPYLMIELRLKIRAAQEQVSKDG